MNIDPFERMWEAPVEEKVQASGEEPMPAGQHILQISWKDIVIEEWAKKPSSNPEGSVLKVGLTKPGYKIVYDNIALDPNWNWKLKSLYDAAGLEWGQPAGGLIGQKIAVKVVVTEEGYRNVKEYKSLDAVAASSPKSKPQKQTKMQKVEAETGADLDSIPF